jgi:hypothetical protein
MGFVWCVPRVWVDPKQIAKALRGAERALSPDVVRIRFTLYLLQSRARR